MNQRLENYSKYIIEWYNVVFTNKGGIQVKERMHGMQKENYGTDLL